MFGIIGLLIILVLGIVGVALRCTWEMIKVAVTIVFGLFVLALVLGCVPEDTDGDLVHTKELTEENHLPTKCRPFYNDGTDRWKDCMGVGYVSD